MGAKEGVLTILPGGKLHADGDRVGAKPRCLTEAPGPGQNEAAYHSWVATASALLPKVFHPHDGRHPTMAPSPLMPILMILVTESADPTGNSSRNWDKAFSGALPNNI